MPTIRAMRAGAGCSAFRNAGEEQSPHVTPAVARLPEWVDLPKLLDRKVGLQRQQLRDIGSGLVASLEMAKGCYQRLVPGDEIGMIFHCSLPENDGPLIV